MDGDNREAACERMGMFRESEQMYRDLVERSNDGVVVLQDRRIKFVNRRFCDMSGYSADTLLGSVFTDYLTPEETNALIGYYEKRMAGEKVSSIYETVLTSKAGNRIPLEISAAIISFDSKPADLVLVRDITERKLAEQYLQRYRLLSETTGDMVLFVQLDGTIIEANRAAMERHNFTRDEFLRTSIFDLVVGETRETVRERIKEAQSHSIRFESAHRRKDGSSFPVEVTASSGMIGERPVILAIERDITERQRFEAALQEGKNRLQALLEALPVAVVIADANGRITEANDEATTVWGGPPPRVNGVEEYGAYQGWWPETGEQLMPEEWALARALTKGETIVGEVVHIQRFDGECATILNSAAPIRDSEGRIVGGVVTIEDVSELVKLREALERSLEETRTQSRRTEVLLSVAEAGLSLSTLQDMLSAMVEKIARAFDVDISCIFVLDEATQEFTASAVFSAPSLAGRDVEANQAFIDRVAREGGPVFIPDTEHDPTTSESCRSGLAARSMLGVPLIARSRTIGVMRVQSMAVREFSEDEVRLLQALADHAALAIDNARLYDDLQQSQAGVQAALDAERGFCLLLQRALLPPLPTIGEGYEVAVRYVPMFYGREVGGDFYDVFRASDGWAGVVVGDVSGKGLEAASLAATTRSTIHAFVHETQHTGDVLARANSVLYGQQPGIESFVTVCLVTLDLSTGDIQYSSAGHPPAAILRADGSVEFLKITDLPVGVVKTRDYAKTDARLQPGDKLLLYTDGISEAHAANGMMDIEGIASALAGHSALNADEVADKLIAAATRWADGKLSDDAAVVVVSRRG